MEAVQGIPTLDGLRSQRADILLVAARHGAQNIRVFGSVARGEAQPDSDVDLIVDMEPGRSVLDLSELILDLQDVLGRRVDVIEIRQPSPQVESILQDAIPL